jgi:hypothetical protein
MSETIELQGRAWQACELEHIRQWVAQNPTWSRYACGSCAVELMI